MAGAVLLAGCDTSPSVPQTPEGSSLPAAACDLGLMEPADNNPRLTKELATRCAAALGDGRVALVVFDGVNKSKEELDVMADEIEDIVDDYTDGIFSIDAEVVEASGDAEKKREDTLGGDSCVRPVDHQSTAAVADETMPELREYDFIIGLDPRASCTIVLQGLADDGRHADVYMGGLLGMLQNKEEFVAGPASAAAAHELLHELGIGHDGIIKTLSPAIEFGGTLDVKALAEGKEIELTGKAGSVMSNSFYLKSVTPNPLHLERLRWPDRVQGARPYASEISSEGVTLGAANYDGEFFTLRLKEPFEFDGYESAFNGLAIVPKRSGQEGRFEGFAMSVTVGGQVLWFDSAIVRRPGEAGTMVLDLGSQRIEIEVDPGGENISARLVG